MEIDRFLRLCQREVEQVSGWEYHLDHGQVVRVYTDGGTIGWNGPGGSTQGGTWAWCGEDSAGVRIVERSGILTPDEETPEIARGVTNNQTEFFAICKALAFLPDGWDGVLLTDSRAMISRLQWAHRREMSNTPVLWQRWFWHHLERMGAFTVEQVKGHAGVAGNEWCDAECRRLSSEAQKEREHRQRREIPLTVAAGLRAALT